MTRRIEWLHDDRLARPNPGFTFAEWETLWGLAYVNIHMRHFFLPGMQNALLQLERHGVKPMLYTNILHAPRVTETEPGTWDRAWAEVHSPGCTRYLAWRAAHGGPDLYWIDPERVTPHDVFEFLLHHIEASPVRPAAVFLDHGIERPWLYDERRPLTDAEWPVQMFHLWQVLFPTLFEVEGIEVWVNGRWPLDAPNVWHPFIHGKQWERCGNRWAAWRGWSAWLRKVGAWTNGDRKQLLDLRGHGEWPPEEDVRWYERWLAELLARTRSHIFVRYGRL